MGRTHKIFVVWFQPCMMCVGHGHALGLQNHLISSHSIVPSIGIEWHLRNKFFSCLFLTKIALSHKNNAMDCAVPDSRDDDGVESKPIRRSLCDDDDEDASIGSMASISSWLSVSAKYNMCLWSEHSAPMMYKLIVIICCNFRPKFHCPALPHLASQINLPVDFWCLFMNTSLMVTTNMSFYYWNRMAFPSAVCRPSYGAPVHASKRPYPKMV